MPVPPFHFMLRRPVYKPERFRGEVSCVVSSTTITTAMLLRLSALVAVGVCLMAGRAGAQQGVAAADKTALLQLASPVAGMSSQLQKRNTKDNAALATGFTGGHHGHHHHAGHHLGHGAHHGGGGKFFMYAHQPEHKHYEFGFKRGNDKHVVERYEKGGPHHNFKSKFRWHDKHGGHGERYWDYNHGDSHHHDDGGDGGHHHHDDHHHHHDDGHHHDHHDGGHGYHSEPVPEFVQPGAAYTKDAYRHRRKSSDGPEKKSNFEKKPTGLEKKMFVGPKEQQLFKNPLMMQASQPAQQPQAADSPSASQAAFNDMLGFDPFSPPEILKDHSSVGGINSESSTPSYRTQPSTMPPPIAKPYFSRNTEKKMKQKKQYKGDTAGVASEEVPKLAFDLDSGRVFDEKTGKWFRLVAD